MIEILKLALYFTALFFLTILLYLTIVMFNQDPKNFWFVGIIFTWGELIFFSFVIKEVKKSNIPSVMIAISISILFFIPQILICVG